jgi:5-formyltetrahydrofolate cyclo-ligase
MDIDPEALAVFKRKAKIHMRKRARAVRGSMSSGAIATRSAEIVRRLSEHPLIVAATGVALFHPMEGKHEVDLRALDASIRARGGRVAYPSIDPDTREMVFRWVADPSAMEERGLGFSEPNAEDPEATGVEVIVVPALAVDPRGHRIGYGAGFYDRTIPRYVPPARTIAVAFDFQLVPEVPETEGDVTVEWIVTDTRAIEVSTEAAAPDMMPGRRTGDAHVQRVR